MPEQPFGVAAQKVELMLAAFLAHRPDVPDGLRARHLRDELREQMRFGPRSLQHLIAEEHQFFEHHLLRAKHDSSALWFSLVASASAFAAVGKELEAARSDSSDMTISDFRVSAKWILTGVGPNIEVHQTGVIATA